MAPYSLYERINGEGYKISLEDTELLFDKYCETFHVAIGWLRDQGAAAVANDKFWQQTRTGRLRYWNKPEWPKIYAACEAEYGKNFDRRIANYKYKGQMAAIEREAGNNPIQSMNADMTNLAMYRLRKEIKKRKLDAFICGSVYDEIVVNTAESCGQEVHDLQKTIMIDSANGYLTHVKMEVEGHLAKCWTK
jgi:DNA polymerase I-like protein with 3'-5' exonuclease and polymerase domains